MAAKTCKARKGKGGPVCGAPVAPGMLACCAEHPTVMIPSQHPGIYMRGNRYVVVWRHRGKQKKSFHTTLALAREAKGQKQAGDTRPTSRIGFEEYFDSWIESYAGRTARGFSDRSRELYRGAIEDHAIPRWGTWRLAEPEPIDVRELLADLREAGYATATIKLVRSSLSAMFSTAVEDGLLRSNATSGVRIPVGKQQADVDEKAKALTRAELKLLLAALDDEWLLLVEFLVATGLRISEAIGLTWKHLDLGARPRVQVREQFYDGQRSKLKSRHGRRDVPLAPLLAERLRVHRRDKYAGERAPVFATSTGTELNRSNFAGRVLKPAAKAAGLVVDGEGGEPVAWVSPHTMRHTCASMLFDAGKNVKQVQTWLGHADPVETLRTYAHLMDDGLGDADFMDEWATLGQHNTHEQPQTCETVETTETVGLQG